MIPLHLAISEQLRDRILAGLYQPDDQLSSEHQLMSKFEVSRITTRRAIANLTQQGLVTVRWEKGALYPFSRK